MATVTTTTVTDSIAPPGNAPIVYSPYYGHLYVAFRSAADILTVYRSTDNGGSWATFASFTHTGLQEWSSLVADTVGYLHLAYRVGTGTADTIHYRRCTIQTATWSSGLQTSATDANGGSIGSVWQGVDLAVVRNADGGYAIVVAAARSVGTSSYGMQVMGVSISPSGAVYLNNPIISSTRAWTVSGTPPGRSGVQCEVEHTGDGVTTGTQPNVWISWGRTTLRMVKLAWQGAAQGWQGPTQSVLIRSGLAANDYVAARWDGTQYLMGVISPDDTTKVRVYQRQRGNTQLILTIPDTPALTTGVVKYIGLSYDNVTKNIRAYAVGTSTALLYYCDYVRSGSAWSAWTTVSATAVSNTGTEWGVRKGGSSLNARHDVITNSGASSPFTITHTAQVVSSAPSTSSFNTSGQAYLNGGAADVGAALPLAWTFKDADPGDTQGSYALSRQIGAGALAYWRASDSTWQAAEVQNASTTQGVTLPTAWGADADAVHTYKVKVWDAAGVVSPGYSAGLQLIPSVKVNPTVSTPVAASTLTVDSVTVAWTVAEQTAYRIVLTNTGTGVVTYDSGKVSAGTGVTSVTVPYSMATGTTWSVSLTTYNNEGLASTPQVRAFSVAYPQPPAPISTLVAQPSLGYISVTEVNLAPVGAQPAIASLDLYRRTATTPVLNANPSMAGNVTGWQIGGGGTPGTLTYSTAQFHDSPGSARYVPNAAGAAIPQVEQATSTVVTSTQVVMGSVWIRPDTANKPLIIGLNWFTAADVYISSTTYVLAVPVAGAWHYLEVWGDASGIPLAGRVRVAAGETSTPTATDAFYVDELKLELGNTATGTRIAQLAGTGAVVNDWGAPHGIPQEYRWIAKGANGTTNSGPWTE